MSLRREESTDGREWITYAMKIRGGARRIFRPKARPPEIIEGYMNDECESRSSDQVQKDIPNSEGYDEERGPWDYFISKRPKR